MKTNQAQEQLNKISTEFELELTRLIKTLNLISQSRELYKNHVENIEIINTEFKNRINYFKIKILAAERENAPSTTTPQSPQQSTPTVLTLIDELNEYLEQTSLNIENSKNAHITKIDSIYSVLNLELQSSQQELDIRIQALQQQMTNIQSEAGHEQKPQGHNTAGEQVTPEPETEEEQEPPSSFNAPRTLVTANLDSDEHHIISRPLTNQLLMGLMLLFIGILAGIVIFYVLNIQDIQNYEQNSTAQITANDKTQTKENGKIAQETVHRIEDVHDEILITEKTTEIPVTGISLEESIIEKTTQTPDNKIIVSAADTETTVPSEYQDSDSQSNQEPKKPYETTHNTINKDQGHADIEKTNDQAKQEILNEDISTAQITAEGGDQTKENDKIAEPVYTRESDVQDETLITENMTEIPLTRTSPGQSLIDELTQTSEFKKRVLANREFHDTDLKIYTPRVVASIRGGPGTNYNWIMSVRGGQRIYALGDREDGWIKVKTPDGKEGWVLSRLLTEVK